MKTQPAWINKQMFPFESKWFGANGEQMHFIDEGSGETIVFVHGCPEWSFGFRDVVKMLRASHRCVVVDHLGFGLSDKPLHGDFSVSAHSVRLKNLIQHLALKNITLVGNDFGGGIGLGYAVTHPDNINGILLFNTWCWSLKEDAHFKMAGKMMKTQLMKLLYKRFNFSVNVIMPRSFTDKSKFPKEVHDHYRNPLPDANSRTAVYAIARELMDASDWWQAQWEKTSVLRDKPVKIYWGMKDTFVPATMIDKWKHQFPDAEVVKVADAGHFLQEERPDIIATGIEELTRSYAMMRV